MILNTLLNMYIEKDNILFVHNERAKTILCLHKPLYLLKKRTCYSVLCYHINVETYVAYAVPGHFVHYLYETNTFKGVIIP